MAEGRSARTRALNEELHQYARRKDYANVMATLARGEQDKTVDGRTFAIAISACADAGDAAGAVRLLRAAAERGGKCAPEVAACTACVKALCGDDLPGARELLRAMARAPAATPRFGALAEAARPNARTANTFLRGCLRHGDWRAADWCVEAMEGWGLEPDANGRAYVSATHASALRPAEARAALRGFDEAEPLVRVARAHALLGDAAAAVAVADEALALPTSEAAAGRAGLRDDARRAASNDAFRAHRAAEARRDAELVREAAKRASASATLAALAKVVVCDHLRDPAATVDALKRAFGLEEVAYRAAREALGAGASRADRKRVGRRVRDALAAVEARRAGALDVRALVAPGAATAHVELGCGDGEWAAARAGDRPDEAWLCCEWRHDRAAAVVGRAALSRLANLGVARGAALPLVAALGAASVDRVYANFPEPPAQTGAVDGDFDGRHMLDGPCLHAVAKALRPGGALTVVTDNEWYARLSADAAAAVGGWATPALTSAPGERYVRHYARGAVAVYAGAPGPAVGHGAVSAAGDSFFDRLWRRGVSQHASAGDRYVLHLVRNGDAPREPEARAAAAAAAPPEKRKRRVPTGGKYGKKKKKKKKAAV